MRKLTSPKHRTSVAATLALALSLIAIPGTAWSGLREDVRDFRDFLRDRPRIAAELRANPNLVMNRRYLDNHNELARFLRHRPALREEIRANPGRVLGGYSYDRYARYDRYDRYGRWR